MDQRSHSGLLCVVSLFTAVFLGPGQVRAQLTVTLVPSVYNGVHVSCFGGDDGAIDLTVSGGQPPYTFEWSTGATTEDVSGLRAGFVSVTVHDANQLDAREDLTLTEPLKLEAIVEPYLYASGYNISCVNCVNGSIAVTASEGVAPYTYAWADGPTTEDRVQLDAGSYQVDITDANGCVLRSNTLQLTQPERDDWGKSGNAGTDPNTQFIGTTDDKDLVFKSNGAERLRLLSTGEMKISGPSLIAGPLYRDGNGMLRSGGFEDADAYPCAVDLRGHPYWKSTGNDFPTLCENVEGPVLGTKDAWSLRVITNNVVRMTINTYGKVGIGTVPPTGEVDQYRLFVDDGIVARDVLVKHGDWPDFVFAEAYRLMPLGELRAFVMAHSHLPGLPSAAELDRQGGVALGTHARDLTRTVEEQALYILQLEERLDRMEQRLNVLEASKQ